jgi:hypothetical protein
VEKAKYMRHASGLSQGFWKFAVKTAVFIHNRTPTRIQQWKTPIEKFLGKQPDASYFQVFGCKAMVHIHKDIRKNKLDAKARPTIFLGYHEGSKGYEF